MRKYFNKLLPKKRLTVKELSIRLYQLSFTSEVFDLMTEQLLNADKDTKLVITGELLDFNIAALLILAIDYSIYLVFGNTNLKDKILDEFYELVKDTWSEKIYDLLNERIIELSKVLKDENPNTPFHKLGMYFSKCISKNNMEDIMVGLEVINIFSARVISLADSLKGINVNYKLIF